MMSLINEAYEVLSNPAKRKEYDVEYKENVVPKPKNAEEFKWGGDDYEYYSESDEDDKPKKKMSE